jgi:hypothetical protein
VLLALGTLLFTAPEVIPGLTVPGADQMGDMEPMGSS